MLEKFRFAQSEGPARDPYRQYLQPHPALRAYVAHYTLYYPFDAPEEFLSIVPDASGCLMFRFEAGGGEGYFLGASTAMARVPNRGTPPRLFIEFLPGGAHRLLPLPHHQLADSRVLLGQALGALERQVLDCVEQADGPRQLADSLDSLLLRCLEQRPGPHPVLQTLLALPGEPGVEWTAAELARRTGYSQRHATRLVKQHLGIGPKAYLRIHRMNRVLGLLTANPEGFAALAAEAGYFDQAHFIHDFHRVCGVTPRQYLESLSAFYKEPFKF